ncbi:MAG: type II toxin-antitoxin system VapC family toxin [Candidatus Omnitrophota bacterium]
MLYFDTNVIVYSIVNQDENKLSVSQRLIDEAFEKNSILISPLVLQEMIFTLGKLGVDGRIIEENIDLWSYFSIPGIDNDMIQNALQLCKETKNFKIINDAIHVRFAEKYCTRLITFDNHFNKFKELTYLPIDIL